MPPQPEPEAVLKQRVITAVVLLLILLGVLTAPGILPFTVFLLLVLVLGLFEWWRLTLAARSLPPAEAAPSPPQERPSLPSLVLHGRSGISSLLPAGAAALAIVLFILLLDDYATLAGMVVQIFDGSMPEVAEDARRREAILALVFVRLWLYAGVAWVIAWAYISMSKVERQPFSLLATVFGFLALPAAGAALLAAYDRGVWYLVTLLALVWAADITAYFVGRALGGAKLAPAISPGKTWSGALGGVLGVIIAVVLLALLGRHFEVRTMPGDLVQVWGWPMAIAWSVLLAAFSIVGDLYESLLKRRAGRKDSSQLLPGHGGVLDRIDAVLPVAPLAMLLVLQ